MPLVPVDNKELANSYHIQIHTGVNSTFFAALLKKSKLEQY